jgi:hypothetical protein
VAATLVLDIITNASKAVSGIKEIDSAAGKAGQSVEKSGSKFGGFAKAAGLAIGGAALGGVIKMFKTGVDEQKDFLSGQAQLANGIKSTGNAAHVSVGGLEDLASSIQNYSGQTDDSIVASEKLLLTFTGVRNAAGKNNDIFNQATKMTADMAAKMGGDASKYAVQLGKALNDPAKGVSKLTKIGVTFTDAQKKQIAAMQKAGDTVGAQKVIMAELRKEFGGSAKAAGQTLPGQMARAKRSFEDVSQSLVASFMPALTLLADILTKTVMPAFSAVIGWMTSHKGAVLAFAAAIGAVYTAIKVGQASAALGQAGGLVAWIKQTNLAAGATKIWSGVQAVFNAIMDANPVAIIVLALVALVAALVLAYKKSAAFRAIVQAVFRGLAAAAKVVWGAIVKAFHGIVAAFDWIVDAAKAVVGWIKSHWKLLLLAVLLGPIVLIVKLIIDHFQAIVDFFKKIPGWIRSALSGLFDIIVGPYKLAWQWISGTLVPLLKSALNAVPAAIGRALSTVANLIYTPFKQGWDWISRYVVTPVKNAFTGTPAAVARAVSGVANALYTPFKQGWDWINSYVVTPVKNAFSGVLAAVGRALSGVANAIYAPFKQGWDWIDRYVVGPVKNAFTGIVGAIGRAMSGVAAAIEAPFSAAWTWIKKNVIDKISAGFGALGSALKTPINAVIRAWNNLSFTIGGFRLPFPPHTKFPSVTISTPNLPLLESGAYVTRATAAVVGEGRSAEFVAPEPMLRQVIRDELGRAGGNVYNFQIPPTANPAETGRVIIKAIQAYERAAGAGWRSA